MRRSDAFLWWRGHGVDRPCDGHWLEIGEEAFQEDERRITGRHRLPCPVPAWAEDLFPCRQGRVHRRQVRKTERCSGPVDPPYQPRSAGHGVRCCVSSSRCTSPWNGCAETGR